MRHDKRNWAGIFGGLFLATAVFAATAPSDFKETVSLGGKSLVKNGEGLRTAIFGIEVYKAALYLPEKTDDASKVLASPAPKQLEMRFVRKVSAEDMKKAWDESFRKNCGKNCDQGIAELEKLKSFMKDAAKGDVLTLDLLPGGVKVAMNGTVLGETHETPADGKFANQLLAIWLGEHPPSNALKAGLLGR